MSRSLEEIEQNADEIIREVKKARACLVKIEDLLEKTEATQTTIYSLNYTHDAIKCLDEAFCYKLSEGKGKK